MFIKSKRGRINSFMYGRTGNQFFQYAFARFLQLKFFPDYQIYVKFVDRPNTLQFFNVTDIKELNGSFRNTLNVPQFVFYAYREIVRKFSQSLADKSLRFFNSLGMYIPRMPSIYERPKPSRSKNIICRGFFEAYKYSADILDVLREEFTPKFEVMPKNREMMSRIENSESVCVAIRRGDFLEFANFNVCNEGYFYEAMSAIRKQKPDCKFFVFSDDIEGVKKTFNFPFEVTYETGDDPVWETLRLMYSCKHFIISNSTFSWWAQNLSRNKDKIVYAPSPWRWNEDCSGVYAPYMNVIKIK